MSDNSFDLNKAAKNLHDLQKVGEAMGLHEPVPAATQEQPAGLREALGELLDKFERHATYRLISQDETELTGNFRWLPTGKCYIEEVRYQQMLALSLSSPIEPRLADQVSILRTTCDCHIATIEAMQREIDELKAQASSEIRERVQARQHGQRNGLREFYDQIEALDCVLGEGERHGKFNSTCARCVAMKKIAQEIADMDALAPSRQGAGGK